MDTEKQKDEGIKRKTIEDKKFESALSIHGKIPTAFNEICWRACFPVAIECPPEWVSFVDHPRQYLDRS